MVMTIKKAASPPTIDGLVYAGDPWTSSWNPLTAYMKSDSSFDMTANFQMMYDDTNLYIITRVIENTQSNSLSYGGIEVYLTLDTSSGANGAYKAGDFQFREVGPYPNGLQGGSRRRLLIIYGI